MQRLKAASMSGHDGVWSEPDPDGEFVSADEANETVGKLVELLKRFTRHELPDPEFSTEDETTLIIGHIDHEHYRHSVRLAKEFLESNAAL